MLSRIAENFYWIGRYVERINNTASLLDVTHLSFLEKNGDSESIKNIWESLIAVNQGMDFFKEFYQVANENTVHSFLIFSRDNPSSILNCVGTIREDMRTVRNRVSTAMWLIVNEFYLGIKDKTSDEILSLDQAQFYRRIKDFCLAFYGAADNTLMHDEAWQFLRLGRALERALETASILDLKYHILLESIDDVGRPVDLHQWHVLLRSVDGLESYLNTYLSQISPSLIAELLIQNRKFPKSVMFNLREMKDVLKNIPHEPDSGTFWALSQKLIGLLTDLASTSIPHIFEVGFHEYLGSMIEQLESINNYLYQTYFGFLGSDQKQT